MPHRISTSIKRQMTKRHHAPQSKYERCVREVGRRQGSKTYPYNAYAVCHASTGKVERHTFQSGGRTVEEVPRAGGFFSINPQTNRAEFLSYKRFNEIESRRKVHGGHERKYRLRTVTKSEVVSNSDPLSYGDAVKVKAQLEGHIRSAKIVPT